MDVNLVLFKKDGSQKAFSVPGNITIIGRRHDCDLCIPLKPVSRRHCQLYFNDQGLKVRDLGSRNGTYLNNERIEEASAKAGDYLRIGPLTFLLQIDNKPERIVPPDLAAPKAPPQPKQKAAQPAQKVAAIDDSEEFPELDGSDSFLLDLEDV
jgi:pSer/pThr/pTyr-binding forkhead associated (FHA) protein